MDALRKKLSPSEPPEVISAGYSATAKLIALSTIMPILFDRTVLEQSGFLRPDEMHKKMVSVHDTGTPSSHWLVNLTYSDRANAEKKFCILV